jgi:molybdopterin-guanine dinucleotide biosynthesis protein A
LLVARVVACEYGDNVIQENRAVIVGVILAGGKSRRFGSPKAPALLAGLPLVEHAARRLRCCCARLALAGGDEATPWRGEHLVDPDVAHSGPLAGVLAGLVWAEELKANWLVTAPCDTPLLPVDYVPQLHAAATQDNVRLAAAATASGLHPLCAIWHVSLRAPLEAKLTAGHPPIHELIREFSGAAVSFADEDAFLNVNTPGDLTRAEALLLAER